MEVGQKVICIEACTLVDMTAIKSIPLKDSVYTIRSIVTDGAKSGVRLVEIINPVCKTNQGMAERAFPKMMFSPIEYIRTDIKNELENIATAPLKELV